MRQGYSLLECVMAIGLLGLVVLSMSGLFLSSQASAVHSLEGSQVLQGVSGPGRLPFTFVVDPPG